MFIGLLHVKCRYCRHILVKSESVRQVTEKHSDTKFHENSSVWSRVVQSGRTDD